MLMFASTYTGINIFHKAFISQEGTGADGYPKGTAKLPGWLRDALEGEFRTWFVPEAGAWHTGTHCVLEMNEDTRCIVSDSLPASWGMLLCSYWGCFSHWQSEFIGKNMRTFGCVLDLYQGEYWLGCLLPSFFSSSLPCSLSLSCFLYEIREFQILQSSNRDILHLANVERPPSVAGKHLDYFTLIPTPPSPPQYISGPWSCLVALRKTQWSSEMSAAQMSASLC